MSSRIAISLKVLELACFLAGAFMGILVVKLRSDRRINFSRETYARKILSSNMYLALLSAGFVCEMVVSNDPAGRFFSSIPVLAFLVFLAFPQPSRETNHSNGNSELQNNT